MLRLSHICDLLDKLQDIASHDPPHSSKESNQQSVNQVVAWFKSHRKAIDALSPEDTAAFLSTLLPQRRKDRIYGIQSASLAKLLGRSLGLGSARRHDLERYKDPGNGDLADCLERVLRSGGPPALPPVCIPEVDNLMQYLAGQCRFSAEEIQRPRASSNEREQRLKNIFLRTSPTEARWMVRLILKDLSPAILNESLVLRLFHFLIPDVLNIYDNIEMAAKVLKDTFKGYPSQPDEQSRVILRQTAAASLRPIPGVMIARSEFCKARSIQQCLQMTNGRRWLIDRKYDGEYCQIHVDLSKGKDWIKIFSKSGRDSTRDRQGIHNTIRECLRVGSKNCQFKTRCIIVGEMTVYSDVDKCIVSFDAIRKHVSRAGSLLGANHDLPPHPEEHLMMVFFDLLLVDDENLLNKPIEQRRARLSGLYKKIDGRAQTAESTVIDFGMPESKRQLVHQFAASNALRHEGLVLKSCAAPYFWPTSSAVSSDNVAYCPKMIKLKKDYIVGLGDEADFAVIGASYNAQEANKRPGSVVVWTHFHLGCLMNESDVDRFQADPIFKFVGTISMDQCIPAPVLQQISVEGKFVAEKPPTTFSVQAYPSFHPDVYFQKPFVFEVLGSSYVRPSDCGYFMLRHPRVKKMHSDRTWRECITFDQLQNAAQEALAVPADTELQENLDWMERLEASCKGKFARMSNNFTPSSARSIPTPRSKTGPRRSRNPRHDTPLIFIEHDSSSPLPPHGGVRALREETAPVRSGKETSLIYTQPTSSPLQDKSYNIIRPSRKRPSDSDLSSSKKKCIVQIEPTPADSRSRSLVAVQDTTSKMTASLRSLAENKACFFQKTVVHVDRGLKSKISQVLDRLGELRAVVVQDLGHWDRECSKHAPLIDTVSESQSFPGLQKIVLVEGKQRAQLYAALARVMKLNRGALRESIRVYDHRVMDVVGDDATGDEARVRGYAIGIVEYNERAGHSVFVPFEVGSSVETTG